MLVLLLAVCGNSANLMLARASTRQREAGIRLALGARRARIAGLLLTESVILSVAGAALGAAVAVWGTNAIRAVPMIGSFPIRFQTDVDLVGLALAVSLGIVCGVIFGMAPATHLAGMDAQQALRAGARTASRSRLRNALMGLEVALALIVLVIAAMFFRSFTDARGIDPGFRREGVLLAAYDLTGRNADDAAARAFASRLLDRLRAVPGIEAAAISHSDSARYPRSTVAVVRHRGSRPSGRRARSGAEQYGDTGVLAGNGDSADRGNGFRAAHGFGGAASGDRERRVRSTIPLRTRTPWTASGVPRAAVRDCGSGSQLTLRILRRATYSHHLLLVSRSPVDRRRNPRADASRRRDSRRE